MREDELAEALSDLPKNKLRAIFDQLLEFSHSDDLWGDLELLYNETIKES